MFEKTLIVSFKKTLPKISPALRFGLPFWNQFPGTFPLLRVFTRHVFRNLREGAPPKCDLGRLNEAKDYQKQPKLNPKGCQNDTK